MDLVNLNPDLQPCYKNHIVNISTIEKHKKYAAWFSLKKRLLPKNLAKQLDREDVNVDRKKGVFLNFLGKKYEYRKLLIATLFLKSMLLAI